MSIPVDDCEPLIGPSTAMTPGVGDAVEVDELEQPAAITAAVASEAATRMRKPTLPATRPI
jgi:hypothetical protein